MNTTTSLLTALLCLLLSPLASRAAFNPIPGHVYEIRNRQSATALEVGGDNRYANGHRVNLWPYWGGANQQWSFERVGTTGSDYKIYNRNSRQALRILSTDFVNAYTDMVLPVGQSSTNIDNIWTITELPSGALTISRKYQTPYYQNPLTFLLRTDAPYPYSGGTTGTNTIAASPDADPFPGKYQWDVVDRSASQPGVFRIMNYNSGKALSATANNSNRVSQWTMWYLAGQEWTFSDYNADGYLYIINRNTGQVLEIGGGGDLTQPGRTANLWDNYGHPWQQWALLDINDSHRLTVEEIFTTGMRCKIYNRHSGKVLEIGGNGNELLQEDRAANQWYDWSGPNQQWNIYIDSNYRGTASGTVATAENTGESALSVASATTPSPLTLYPNPARTTLRVAVIGQSELSRVTLTDAKGHMLSVPCRQGQVDVSGLAPGLYLVTITDGQHTYRQKFIKE